MRERRIQAAEVALVLAAPDEIDYGQDGELIARKRMARRTIEVVYDELGDLQRGITVMVV